MEEAPENMRSAPAPGSFHQDSVLLALIKLETTYSYVELLCSGTVIFTSLIYLLYSTLAYLDLLFYFSLLEPV